MENPARIKFDASGESVLQRKLEKQLCAELEDTRIEGVGDLELITSPEIIAEAAVLAGRSELGMVPRIEALGAELKFGAAIFTDHKPLEQRQVPVVSTGTSYPVEPEIAPGSRRRSRE